MEALTEFWVIQLLGRFHPLVVHFPIGLIVVASFMELMTFGNKRPGLREGIRWMIYIGLARGGRGAVRACSNLWLLHSNYKEPTLENPRL